VYAKDAAADADGARYRRGASRRPGTVSAGLAEIKSNIARVFDVLDEDVIALRGKMDRTLSDKVRAAFYNNAARCRAL
jgi:hypothetical protein